MTPMRFAPFLSRRARWALLLALGVLALGASACMPQEGAYVARHHRTYEVPLNNVGLADQGLSRRLAVENQGSALSAANTLEVWVELRNRSDARQAVSARTRFYDADRRPLEATQWTRLFVEARALTNYRALATRRDAAYYYVEIQEGH